MLKKITFCAVLVFLAGVFSFSALAQETEELPQPGVLPDSPFYFIKSFFEDVGTFFVFDEVKKAERLERLAQKRIAEVEALTEKGKTEKVEKVMERYEKHINQAMGSLERTRERNEEKAEKAIERINLQAEKHLNVLEQVRERVSEQARETIEKVIEKREEIMEKKRERVQEEVRVRANESDEEVCLENCDDKGQNMRGR